MKCFSVLLARSSENSQAPACTRLAMPYQLPDCTPVPFCFMFVLIFFFLRER